MTKPVQIQEVDHQLSGFACTPGGNKSEGRRSVVHVMCLLQIDWNAYGKVYGHMKKTDQQAKTASHCSCLELDASSCISGVHKLCAPCTFRASTIVSVHSCMRDDTTCFG